MKRSRHIDLEIAHAVHVGHRPGEPPPLGPGEPVPGCACDLCTGIPEDDPVRQRARERDELPVEAARQVSVLGTAELLGLRLRRVGKSWRGPCPLHAGDGPNFSVVPVPEPGFFNCFVCGAAGDAIALWMGVNGVGFVEAVSALTNTTGTTTTV